MAKFIPNGDLDFRAMARGFAATIAKDPDAYVVSREDAEALTLAVQRYGDALQRARFGGGRSSKATFEKDAARADLEKIIRWTATLIRANEKIDPAAKFALNLSERPAKAARKLCPQEPPRLRFVQALHRASAGSPMHELRFSSLDHKPKPQGATRLELFVDLIAPDEPIPVRPGDNHGGRPWYLRSYTRSPIRIVPPMAKVAMRVVYWARWADSTGNVGPFSASAAGWVEGGNISHRAMRIGDMGRSFNRDDERPVAIEDRREELAPRERDYAVAVIEAHYVSLMSGRPATNALPSPDERDLHDVDAAEAA